MKHFPAVLAASLVFAFSSFAQEKSADAAAVYVKASDTETLQSKDGQKVTVYGTTKESGKSKSGTNFVNFEGAEFYLITFKTDLGEFPDGEPADVFDGKRLAVTGVVSIYKDKPQFKLTDPDQVRILKPDEKFPPKQALAAAPGKTGDSGDQKPVESPEKPAEDEPKKKPPVDPKRFFK
ncbi:MAG: hypothetical protein HKN23_12960 [Verrucomicrobiales bacterium]|nr:hypothetical protein [Verrucomicrobiales bacterium]